MQDQAIALEVIERLDQLGVAYMVVGSLSSNVHGIPRATHDADFVLQLGQTSFATVLRHLEPRFQSDRQLRFEGVTGTKRHILSLNETDVVGVRQNSLDWDYIHHWCDQHGTRGLLDGIRKTIPPMPPLVTD